MNKKQKAEKLNDLIPETPAAFHAAMQETLQEIAAQQEGMKEQKAPPQRKPMLRKQLAVIMAAALVLVTTAAFAAAHWNIFDVLSDLFETQPENIDDLMERNLYKTTVNGVEITIREAGYDGRTLLIQYAYRMPDVDRPLGYFAPQYQGTKYYQQAGMTDEDMKLLLDRHVGWWVDQLWINGKGVNMPGGSGSITSGSTTPGEIIQTEYWRLDQEEIFLSGVAEISLPIGEKQELDEYRMAQHPEKYDEDGNLLLPEKGVVTFSFDTADTMEKVRTEHPGGTVQGKDVEIQVKEACFSPMRTYITLSLRVDEKAMAAFIAQYGEGHMENGRLLWPYTGLDVFQGYIDSLNLVDAKGRMLFPDRTGAEALGSSFAEFLYPYVDPAWGPVYLAPIENGAAQMEYKIPLQEEETP